MENMYKMVIDSYERIKKYIIRTETYKSINFSDKNTEIYFKTENRQLLNCCKVRGAFAKLTTLNKDTEIVAVSSGNHGMSVAYVGKKLGFSNVKIFLSEKTSINKIDKIKSFVPQVILKGKSYDEAHEYAINYSKENNTVFIDPCSDELALSGQGTLALEILEDYPEIDQIFVPLGGGGILGGVGAYIKGYNSKIKVIGVQTEMSPSMFESLKDNVRYDNFPAKGETICDALLGGVGEIPYRLAPYILDEILIVEEKYVKEAIKLLFLKEKNVVEPSGAIGFAAYLQYREKFENKKNCIILSGGNIDEEILKSLEF